MVSEKKFAPGEPACPNACKYCFVTEHDARRGIWNKNPIAGINRACTYINVPPWVDSDPAAAEKFFNFPWEILKGDFVGFTAISDPFWPKLDKYLWHFIEKTSPLAKAVTCVTKWPLTENQMQKLSRYKNFFLVVGITGNNPPVEKFSISQHLKTLTRAKQLKIKVLPIIHPYIAGVSDLSFLPELKKIGYDYISVKGFRYCHDRMSQWLPTDSQNLYRHRENEEILIEDGWRDKVAAAGLKLLSPQVWYRQQAQDNEPHLSKEEAANLVAKIMKLANVTSSADSEKVKQAAIARRL
jgi:DNA repair photolyase